MTKLLHLLLIWKEYITHIQVLAVHVKEYLPFVHKTSIENSEYRGFKVAYVIHFFIFIFLILVFFPLWLSPFWEIWTILLSLSLLTFLQPQRGCFFSSHSFWLFFCWLEWSLWSFKGNPNFQGILNWIMKILHYYCRKQHKDIENSWIIEQNVAISLLFSLLITTCTSFAFLNGRVFSVLGHSLERHKWSFVLYIISFSAFKISFSKLNLAKYHCLHKKPYIFHVFSYHRTSLQIFLL